VADDAVHYEPVSAPNSLLTGKLTARRSTRSTTDVGGGFAATMTQSVAITCAQIATIPTNSASEASVAISSTMARPMSLTPQCPKIQRVRVLECTFLITEGFNRTPSTRLGPPKNPDYQKSARPPCACKHHRSPSGPYSFNNDPTAHSSACKQQPTNTQSQQQERDRHEGRSAPRRSHDRHPRACDESP
jgi:hypothetical protein